MPCAAFSYETELRCKMYVPLLLKSGKSSSKLKIMTSFTYHNHIEEALILSPRYISQRLFKIKELRTSYRKLHFRSHNLQDLCELETQFLKVLIKQCSFTKENPMESLEDCSQQNYENTAILQTSCTTSSVRKAESLKQQHIHCQNQLVVHTVLLFAPTLQAFYSK